MLIPGSVQLFSLAFSFARLVVYSLVHGDLHELQSKLLGGGDIIQGDLFYGNIMRLSRGILRVYHSSQESNVGKIGASWRRLECWFS